MNARALLPFSAPDRTPPHSAEAEEHVIACCLVDSGETIARCITSYLASDSFYFPANKRLFEIIVALHGHGQGRAVTLEMLAEELKTRRQLEAVGGIDYLMQVTGKIPTTAHAGYFIEKVCMSTRYKTLRRVSGSGRQKIDRYVAARANGKTGAPRTTAITYGVWR